MRPLDFAEKVIAKLETAWSTAAALVLFSIMLIAVTDVMLRYAFNAPLDWSFELISFYLMAALFFLSLSQTLAFDQHVRVDIVYRYVSPRVRSALEAVGYVAALAVFAVIFHRGLLRTMREWAAHGVIDGAIAWPTWVSSALVPAGVGLLLLRLGILLLRATLIAIGRESETTRRNDGMHGNGT